MSLVLRRRAAGATESAANDQDAAFMQSSLSWYRFAYAADAATWCRPMSGGEFCVVHDLWALPPRVRADVVATIAPAARGQQLSPPDDDDRWLVTLAPTPPRPNAPGGLAVPGSRPVAWGARSADVLLAVYDLFTFGSIRRRP